MKQDHVTAEKAFLVGLCLMQPETARLPQFHRNHKRSDLRRQAEDHLDELARLAQSAGASVLGRAIQERQARDPALFIGKGLVAQIAEGVREKGIDVVIFDEELSPAQNRNLEQAMQCKVIDRTTLILDIFARRARTREGKIQVELAQMQYLYPRLVGRWMHFSRQNGGIGMRGPGETQLEVDRRLVRSRIGVLQKNLAKIVQERETRREKRQQRELPIVSLVGYTNAGKSSLLNTLSGSEEYTDDRLFATLDPVTRRVDLAHHLKVLVNDTVGFVQKLPHQLIAAFRSTFEEIQYSDLILHVIDASDPQSELHKAEVLKVLEEFKLMAIPRLTVYNKIDLVGDLAFPREEGAFYVSAHQRLGMEVLRTALAYNLEQVWPLISLRIPLGEGKVRSLVYEFGAVVSEVSSEHGNDLEARVPKFLLPQLKPFLMSPEQVVKPAQKENLE